MDKATFRVVRSDLKVVIERTFDAPIDLVFKTLTDPDAIPGWWGKKSHTTTVDQMDVRPGGAWRYVSRDPDGNEYAFHGIYTQIDPPSLIAQTFNFEGISGVHELLQVLTLQDVGGKTRVVSTAMYANLEDLDGMVASGMEAGGIESWERLAVVVERNPEPGP